jgi:hypothetical protein
VCLLGVPRIPDIDLNNKTSKPYAMAIAPDTQPHLRDYMVVNYGIPSQPPTTHPFPSHTTFHHPYVVHLYIYLLICKRWYVNSFMKNSYKNHKFPLVQKRFFTNGQKMIFGAGLKNRYYAINCEEK